MSDMFNGCESIDSPVNHWDTSRVTDMSRMFADAMVFNQPLGRWNTAKIENMSNLFEGARNFNQSINDWDTSRWLTWQTPLRWLTWQTPLRWLWPFNYPIDNWNTSMVTNMYGMFESARHICNQPMDRWDMSKVGNNRVDMLRTPVLSSSHPQAPHSINRKVIPLVLSCR